MSSQPEELALKPVTTAAANPIAVIGGWRQLLVPSMTDCIFIVLIVWLFIASTPGWDRLLGDGDTGWHIRVGESILRTGVVPQTDPFSFSKPDAPWYAWEWLSEILLAVTHSSMGLKGVTLAAGVLIALFAVLLLRYMIWRGATTLVALVVALLSVGAASVHYLARPHLFTFVFLVGSLWALEFDRRNPTKWIWALAPVTVLWTNLHGGFLALFVCLGGLVAGTAIEGLLDPAIRRERWQKSVRYSLLGGACGIASIVNPYGIELHRHIFAYLQSDWIKNSVNEFRSPSFRAENVLQYEVLLLLGVMSAAWLLSRRRVVEAIWILLWAHFSLSSARHIPIFVIFAAPLIASELTAAWRYWTKDARKSSVPGILNQLSEDLLPGFRRTSVWPAVFLVVLLFGGASLKFPTDFPAAEFPVAVIERNAERIQTGRLFADDDWADYLIYRFYPRQRVFMDGRTDFYGPEIGDKFLAMLLGQPGWKDVLEEYQFDLVMIPPERPLAALMRELDSWSIIDSGGGAILFAARR